MHRNRSKAHHRAAQVALETLESRVLLNGLTIVTHGYEPFSSSRPSWITAMGNAIAKRAGPTTAVYQIRVVPATSSTVKISSFTRLSGPSPTSTASTNGETVLLLDWAAASGVLSQYYSTATIAAAVIPYLEQAFPLIGIGAPLVDGPVQLIGHSRGASLVTALANDLGKSGIWVDQVTTLDSVPVGSDPTATLTGNVIFGDNYRQNSGDGLFVPNGATVAGALNVGPLKLGGAYPETNGGTHNDVHLFYQGTINTAANAGDLSFTVPPSYYPNNNLNRNTTGFYYSRIAGGTRPASGIGTPFGGTGARIALNRSGIQWPNVGMVVPSDTSIEAGQAFSIAYMYQDFDSASNVQWFLDTDTNPFDNNSIALADPTSLALSTTIADGDQTLTFNGNPGTYFLEGEITDGTNTRYAYASGPLTVLPPTQRLVLTTPPGNLVAGAVFAQVVQVLDSTGQLLTDNSSIVTISLAGTAGGVLGGTLSVQAVNGVATFPGISIDHAGTYTLMASDPSFLSASSASFIVSPDVSSEQLFIQQQPTNLLIGSALSPSIIVDLQDQFGNLVTFDHSQVSIGIGNGPNGATLSGTSTLTFSNGIATFSTLKLSTAGTYTLSATDTTLPTMPTVQFSPTIIMPGTTTLAKPPVAGSYSEGKTITLQTTLKSNAPLSVAFTGTATVTDQIGDTLGTADVAANGAVKFTLTSVPPGVYTATVSYPGDANHTAATSATFTLHVNLATSTTTLLVSSHSLFFGEPVTLTANVTSPGNMLDHTGKVVFKDGATTLGTVTLSSNTASWMIATPTIGTHHYTATYSGDNNSKADKSPVEGTTVKKDGTQATLTTTATGPVTPDAQFTLTAVVASLVIGSTIPTGTVTFKDGLKVLGTAILDNTGTATLLTSLVGVKTHSLTVHYAGDPLTSPTTSLALLQVVSAAL